MPDQIQQKEQVIEEAVAKLQHFAYLYGIQSIFIVGGYCREHYFGTLWKVNDIDVASAYHEQAKQLGGLFASEVLNSVPTFYERTGTAMVEYASEFGKIKIEFQGDSINAYMHNQEIRTWMQHEGIDDVPLMNNIYGRDFTINSLIYSLHNRKMYDPTQRALNDFERKRVSSLLPPHILLKYNPMAGLRAIRFAVQYDFFIDAELRIAIKEAGIEQLRLAYSEERIVQEVVKILKIKPEEGLDLLKRFELDRILLHPDIKKYIFGGSS